MTVVAEDGKLPETPAAITTRDFGGASSILQKLGFAVVLGALLSGLATYAILTGLTPVLPTPYIINTLLAINIVLVVAMIVLITWQVIVLWLARNRGSAGARLHVRLVTLFALVASIPALLVAIFASVTLDRGLDRWFSERTRSIVETALVVAHSYIQEHGQVIRTDTAAMANDLDRAHPLYENNRPQFQRVFQAQTALRGLAGAFIINGNLTILSRALRNESATFEGPTREAMDKASAGELVIMNPGNTNQVRALVKLKAFEDAYLFVFRFVDTTVIDHLRKTQAGKVEYDSMEARRYGVQFTFALMYVGVALIFLLAAIWFGLWVSDRLVAPIGRLIGAAREVSEGNLDAKVSLKQVEGDLATLGRTFNQMTDQLSGQRKELIDANHMLDVRRRFTEAVLSGVTAGVIGLDQEGRITLVNRSALTLLGVDENDLSGRPLADALPAMDTIFRKAQTKASGSADGQVSIKINGQDRNFMVRVTREQSGEDEHGDVVTFDDITELVNAQRNSAWADIARRIAHEIKNPLTPIQLSAERLKRKYGKDIQFDREIFEQCTDTIIRQVGDIGRMVDEFSTFARMPKATIERRDLCDTVKQAVFLQRVSSSDITFETDIPSEPIMIDLDRRLVTQALTNLVKNATESIETKAQKSGEDYRGRIKVSVTCTDRFCHVDVIDNGVGLPKENRQRLVEPYMTTREKGTGLGLAIVKKIMEEHDGRLGLQDAPNLEEDETGALVRLVFPNVAKNENSTDEISDQAADPGESDGDPAEQEQTRKE